MMRHIALLLLLVIASTASAGAQQLPAQVNALTDMTGRYAIGPWIGSVQGVICQLGNDEPLAGASFVLRGEGIDGDIHATLNDEPVAIDLSALADQPFLKVKGHVYDLHGFGKALALLRQCMSKTQPATLPDQPLEESDPAPVAGTNWQVITLTMADGYVYARLAVQDENRPVSLGLWHYADDIFALSVTSLRGLAMREEPFDVTLTPDKGGEMKLAYLPQESGFLVQLTPQQVQQLAESGSLRIRTASLDEAYSLANFSAVVAALQPRP